MKKYLRAFMLFFCPSFLLSFFYGKKFKVGFSIIISETISFEEGVIIGHGNFINLKSLEMKTMSYIGHFNYIKGKFKLLLKKHANIRHQNKITSPIHDSSDVKQFVMERYASIQIKHLFDVTANVKIGENSLFAGAGTQVWSHSFLLENKGSRRHRIEGDINIGNNVNISARCILLCGITICDNVIIGAICCVSHNITQGGLYVSQSLRYIPYNAEEKLKQMKPYKIEGEYMFFKKG